RRPQVGRLAPGAAGRGRGRAAGDAGVVVGERLERLGGVVPVADEDGTGHRRREAAGVLPVDEEVVGAGRGDGPAGRGRDLEVVAAGPVEGQVDRPAVAVHGV